MTLYYLATPYSKYPDGLDKAYEVACAVAAVLLRQGFDVYSPIAHTHGIAKFGNLDPLDHDLWLRFDEAMLKVCDEMFVCQMEGWEASKGIAYEIMRFKEMGKPVTYVDPAVIDVGSGDNK